ncbi:MAG: SDR family NAD(P)-dependent oxidoreductase [Dehalococcoidia bacterium]
MAKHLEGKVALVTGGAGGIGQWVSRVLAEQGAKVVIADAGVDVNGRIGGDSSRIDAVIAAIKESGGEAMGVLGDVADMADGERFVQTAIEAYGKLDILVCPHGILRERMIFNMTEDEWDEVIRVHLKGCFAVTKFASIHWRTTRAGGRIIYFSSDAGTHGGAGQPNYSAAHAGKLGLMRSNARALGRYGVTCNCIVPVASTRMTDRGTNAQEILQRTGGRPLSEVAQGTSLDPKNVVPIIVWLASDEGGAANGRAFGATGHRITLWREPFHEGSLFSDTPFFDIDKLFDLWPHTIGQYELGLNPSKGMGSFSQVLSQVSAG